MKNSVIKTIALVAFIALNTIALQSQARIMGLLAESADGSENLKIEVAGTPIDASLKISFDGYKTQLEPSIYSAFASVNGAITLQKIAGPDFQVSYVISLSQEPQFPPFFNANDYPESEQQAKSDEWDAKARAMHGPQVQVLNFKKDILAKVIKPEYVDKVYENILNGRIPLILAIQRLEADASDYSYKYIRLDRKMFYLGGVFYQTDSAK